MSKRYKKQVKHDEDYDDEESSDVDEESSDVDEDCDVFEENLTKKRKAKKLDEDELLAEFSTTAKKVTSKVNSKAKSGQPIEDIEDLKPRLVDDSIIKSNLRLHSKHYHDFANAEEVELIRLKLLDWFDKNKRELPWRFPDQSAHVDTEENNRIGYSVWVSEIMLQQTRVQTVIDYFTKWMKRWPTVHDLAKATLEEVNEMWSGLGYYRRAKFLHEGAQLVVSKYDGKLPRTAKELQEIRGIGKYTAGAIASIAFGEVTPLVDGNVIRVLSRVRAIGADPKAASIVKLHWKLAEDIVDTRRPGSFNQALMELGATVCTAQTPSCSSCPLREHCNAYDEVEKLKETNANSLTISGVTSGTSKSNGEVLRKDCSVCGEDGAAVTESVTKYPKKVKKNAQREEVVGVTLVEHVTSSGQAKYFIVQRPSSGLLASLWEFPQLAISSNEKEGEDDEEDEKPKKKSLKKSSSNSLSPSIKVKLENHVNNDLGLKALKATVDQCVFIGTITHLFSHIRQTLHVEWMKISGADDSQLVGRSSKVKDTANTRWVTEEELEEAATSKSVHKCFALLTKHKQKATKSSASTPRKRSKTANVSAPNSKQKQVLLTSMFNK